MRRALPPVAAALLIVGLLAAAVIAAPEREPRATGKGSGPLGLLGERPTEVSPRLDPFEEPRRPRRADRAAEQRANPSPPLERLGELEPERPAGPSRALGRPWAGRLRNGVQLPAWGEGFVTFDSALRRSPSRGWRRFGTDRTVQRTLAVVRDFHRAGPDRPRLAIGDLSRPRGGPFGRKYGGLGHSSHQNGIDVDVYYPRRDGAEVPPRKPREVDRRLAQDLVDRFVAAGARLVFVGPSLDLKGPKSIVKPLVHHDDHLHVRWPAR